MEAGKISDFSPTYIAVREISSAEAVQTGAPASPGAT